MFETKRCIIRSFKEEDINNFMVYRNDLEWMKYQGFKGKDKHVYEDILLKPISFEDGTQLAIISKNSYELIGDLYIMNDSGEWWVGYSIAPNHARKGLIYEVTKGLMNWLRDEFITKRILAGTDENNIASINLLKKLGFEYSHYDKEYDEIIYSYNIDTL